MTVNSLGMLNTYIGLAIPSVAYPMYMYLYYNHFKGMPKELQEAAIIDGASYWKIFTKIMMPLSKPIITTVAIMAFIRSWSDLLWPTLVTRDGTYRTLPLALKSLFSDTYTDWGQVFRILYINGYSYDDIIPGIPEAVCGICDIQRN